MKKAISVIFIIILLVSCAPVETRGALVAPLPKRTTNEIILQPGQSVTIRSADGALLFGAMNGDTWQVLNPGSGAPVPPTPVPPTVTPVPPTVTPVPPTATPGPVSDLMEIWHAPAAHDDDNAHEHGDAPPPWVENFIADNSSRLGIDHLIYGGDESTPGENVYKHNGFKGYETAFNDTNQYFRVHMMTTPLGQSGIFHSLEFYQLDNDNNVSFVQGWVDYAQGDALNPNSAIRNFFQSCVDGFNDGNQPAGRPRIILNSLDCTLAPSPFESWYSDFHPVLPILGNNVEDTYMLEGDPNDPTTWTRSPNNNLGLGRRIEANWDVDKLPRGWFVSDQFGRIMDNIDDPRCGQTVTAHGQQHVVKCLWQYISDTVQPLSFPGNSMQKDFPGRDIVELPN